MPDENRMPVERNMPFDWKGLDEEDLVFITDAYPKQHVKKNTFIKFVGDSEDCVFFIISGRVNIEVSTNKGTTHVFLRATRGHFAGEGSCLLNSLSITILRADVDSVVCRVPWEDLEKLLMQRPDLMMKLYQSTTSKLKSAIQQIEMLSFTGPIRRVMGALHWYFSNEGEEYNGKWRIKTSLVNHQDIADITGFSRVSVSNSFLKLYDSGTISKHDGYYYVDSLEKLLYF